MDKKWLVAVTAGRWQKHGIVEARRAGLGVIAIDADSNAVGFAEADRTICRDLSDADGILKELRSMRLKISGAVSFCSEAGMPLASLIREEFDLPGPDSQLCRRLIDKSLQRMIWTEKQVPGPRWQTARSAKDAIAAIDSIGFPCIIKPTDSSGSRGVTKIEGPKDSISEAVARAFQFSKSGEIIVEAFMDGVEFTVEVFGYDGNMRVLAVTEKKKVAGTRGTVASELATPDRPRAVVDLISSAVIQAFGALGYFSGPGHAEAILMRDGSVGIVEVAGRGGGFTVFDKLVPAASGVNVARLTALNAVALPIESFSPDGLACVLRFFPSTPGTLRSVHGFNEASQIEGVEAECFVKVGDRFSRALADGDRLGFILSRGETPAIAKERADRAEALIHFQFDVHEGGRL